MLTREADYAVRIVLLLAAPDNPEGCTAEDIRKELKLPFAFLRNLLRRLADAGIAENKRGRAGGVTLAKKPAKLTVLDVVSAVAPGRARAGGQWKANLPACDKNSPAFPLFAEAAAKMDEVLATTTLADLLSKTPGNN